ncbi:MAG: site-specific integrase [Thermoleophilaceae bacterium]
MPARMEKTRHPGIYRRGGRYVVVWQHKGRQHKSFHRTLAEAREAKGLRQGGERTPVTRQPFEDYAREWLEGYAGRTSRGFSKASRADYRRALEQHAIPFFRGWKLADVEAPDVRRLVTTLEAKGLAPASVVKNLVPLKALFATAVEDGALRSNPTTGVRVNRRVDEAEEEVEVKAMTRAQLSAVLEATDEEWRPLFELLAHTGLRISELLGLDWSDLEFGARPRLRVRRQFYRGDLRQLKTRSGRRDLPLSPGMARRLWAVRPAKAEGPMFATRNGTRYLDRNLRRVLDRASERAGVEWIGFHTFRHTCASMLFDGGKNVRQVSEWLGHADPSFTMRTYVHLMDDGLGAADFLDQAVVFPRKRSAADPPAAADAAVGAGAAVA